MAVRVRRTTLLLLAATLALPVLGAPASAAATCAGHTATIVGTAAGETLTGTSGDDVIAAGGGDDTVLGNGGEDVICGENGADTLRGGNGSDVLRGGTGDDRLHGELDALVEDQSAGESRVGDNLYGGPGDDLLDSGADPRDEDWFALDTLHYDMSEAPVRVDLVAGTATGQGADTIVTGTLRVVGSPFADVLLGGPGTDELLGGPGNDRLEGTGGRDLLWADVEGGTPDADVVRGGAGRDVILALGGADRIFGGTGNDSVQDAGRTGADRLRGGAGDDRLVDSLVDAAGQSVRGGAGRNLLGLQSAFGTTRPPGVLDLAAERAEVRWQGRTVVVDVRDFRVVHLPPGAWDFRGTSGPDTAYGRVGPNRLFGRAGDDHLEGSKKDDLFAGGAGFDSAQPREGTDTCRSIEKVITPSRGRCDSRG
ncbi:MAG: calcium-binding protein [Nocardioides sp.]